MPVRKRKPANPHFPQLERALAEVYGWAPNVGLRTALQAVVTEKSRRLLFDETTYCRVAAQSPGELHSIAEEIALGETSFFREPEQFRALWRLVLPGLIEKRAGVKRLRLWSAGCSTGEEPFSLAMILEDLLGDAPDWRIEILAVDLRSKALLHASQGRYHPLQLRNLDPTLRERFFHGVYAPDAPPGELDRRLRRNIRLRHANLYDPHLWRHLPGPFDVIVCSNVLTHMHHTAIQQTTARLQQALAPGGYLLVGSAEVCLVNQPRLRVAPTLPGGFFSRPE
ncbi:MAG: methyltransferase [Chloracidobacterium sp.]|nr:methyltransferase [Chloracidobacterium sp.]MDW8216413.1 CheR family methyltransferase [Acidobacteriota bacterium]